MLLQVAADRTYPNGQVIGIDIIPAQPPKGVSTIQGNFLSPTVQEGVKKVLRERSNWKPKKQLLPEYEYESVVTEEGPRSTSSDYAAVERDADQLTSGENERGQFGDGETREQVGGVNGRLVDIVLSDMSEPWEQTTGFWKKSLSDPYYRMMNTSGMSFRDHAGSMDLCNAALNFAFDTLRVGGHFVCKFYQGAEEKALETQLRTLFAKVHREKPESSRSESKEAYFVGLRRKDRVEKQDVFKNE
ncbi:2' O-ribose methyltransferase [Lambiella insularis]|nr:2' O-ribose methyltransferase [Lambiella insularis]